MSEQHFFQRVEIARDASPDGLTDLTVLSPALGRRADITLFAPSDIGGETPVPIVVLLHGVFGSHFAWSRSGRAHTTLNELVASGQVQPMILAMPSDGLFGVGSGYIPRPGENAESWIVDEVPRAVQLVYPQADTSDVSIAGLSMGGWGALRLSGQFPNRFRAAVGMSPLTHFSQVGDYAPEEYRPSHSPRIENPDLINVLTSAGPDLPPIRITCGADDELISDVRALHASLGIANIPHQYAEAPGAHTWDFWAEDIRTAFKFIDSARKTAV